MGNQFFWSTTLDFYNQLPEIEQAQYPAGYSNDLENKISQDFNYQTNTTENGADEMDPINIIQIYLSK